MTKIYLVESGEYSGYAVHAAFADLKDAERVAKSIGDGAVRIMKLYPPGDTSYRRRSFWHAYTTVYKDGKYAEPTAILYEEGGDDETVVKEIGLSEKDGSFHYRTGGVMTIYCTAVTEQAALKGCRDRAAEISAQIVENG